MILIYSILAKCFCFPDEVSQTELLRRSCSKRSYPHPRMFNIDRSISHLSVHKKQKNNFSQKLSPFTPLKRGFFLMFKILYYFISTPAPHIKRKSIGIIEAILLINIFFFM